MQPINSHLPSVQLDARSARVLSILQNLQQVGLFRAIVVKQTGNQVLLDTAFGNITGKAPEQLKAGDEILARLTALKPQPTLKIEQHIARLITLDKTPFKALLQNTNSALLSARVVSQNNQHTLLKINNQVIQINRQPGLQTGETLLLKETGKNQLQLIRLQPQTVLKAALSSLMPRALQLGQQYNLSSLQAMARDLTGSSSTVLIDRANIKHAELVQHSEPVKTSQPNPPPSYLPPSRKMNEILLSLARPLVAAQNIKPQALQQLFSYLSLIKTEMPGNQNHLGQQLQQLLTELKQSPEDFRTLVREVLHRSMSTPVNTGQQERPVIELSNTLRLELMQQVEQTLNQLLTQQSSTRLQLEQQQPLNLFLNIPLQVDQEHQNLKLSIRQKNKPRSDVPESSWEIELSFEFGLLGMITTRVLLQDQKISANFWAQQSSTKNLIDTHMDQFKNQLKKAGFELGLFDCFNGIAPEPLKQNQYNSDNLLDLEA